MSFIVGDTEDDAKELQESGQSGFKKKVTQCAAITRKGTKFHNRGDIQAFKKWLVERPEQYIYFHNLQYDLGNLFGKELDALDCTLVGGRIIRAIWGSKIFLDSFNIWPMKAATIGGRFGLKKLEMDVYSKEYVFRDCEIIRRAMEFAWSFAESMELDHLPPTLGGFCVKVWKNWGGINCHDSNDICREAYYGGRVEIFKTRNESKHVCWTDINSLYPSVMTLEYPEQLTNYGTELPPHGVATITIKIPKADLVILPFRNSEGRIIFPYGTITGTWTMLEIRAAVERGATIQSVKAAYGSAEVMRPYYEFVQRLYEARLQSKSAAEKQFFKLLMNNLYGRLGTTGVIGRTVNQTEKNRSDGVPYGEKVLVEYNMPLSEETNWCHAAYVTAYGRLELFKYMEKVGANLIYCDTDSVIFDGKPDEIPFPIGKGLGQMKIIQRCSICNNVFPHSPACPNSIGFDFWEECEVYLPKLYRTGNTYKAKGVPQALAKKFFETGRAEFNLPYKIREAIRFYDRKNSRRLSVWHEVEKQRRQTYDRKNLLGNRYFPCKVNAV